MKVLLYRSPTKPCRSHRAVFCAMSLSGLCTGRSPLLPWGTGKVRDRGCPRLSSWEYSSNQGVQPISNCRLLLLLHFFFISVFLALSIPFQPSMMLSIACFSFSNQKTQRRKKNRHQKPSPALLLNPTETFISAQKPTPSITGEGMHQSMSRVKAREGK